jgi:5-methylcytosine-specific restriction endonuclease McrA
MNTETERLALLDCLFGGPHTTKRITKQYAENLRKGVKNRGGKAITYCTPERIQARWDMWGSMCYVCGDTATSTDHVIPVSRGGLHVPANLRPICGSCNSTKRNHLIGVL